MADGRRLPTGGSDLSHRHVLHDGRQKRQDNGGISSSPGQNITKAGTEYVRGIPVVKIFQQTVYSFKAFQQAIEDYSDKSEYYQDKVCRVPQSINLTFTEGAFVFLVPVALFLAPGSLASGDFASFVTDFAFYAVFSAIISTALAKIMLSSGVMLASTALGRIRQVMNAPTLKAPLQPQKPHGNKVEFKDVCFTYDGADSPALSHVSFTADPGQTVALVGPSGGGKTTAASLIPRFWDATSGTVEVGGVPVSRLIPMCLWTRWPLCSKITASLKRLS